MPTLSRTRAYVHDDKSSDGTQKHCKKTYLVLGFEATSLVGFPSIYTLTSTSEHPRRSCKEGRRRPRRSGETPGHKSDNGSKEYLRTHEHQRRRVGGFTMNILGERVARGKKKGYAYNRCARRHAAVRV